MENWLWLLVLLPIFAAFGRTMTVSGNQNKFVRLGNIQGMTRAEIIDQVGPPNSISPSLDGTLLQWIQVSSGASYHYAILFDHEDRAVGYTHQHVS